MKNQSVSPVQTLEREIPVSRVREGDNIKGVGIISRVGGNALGTLLYSAEGTRSTRFDDNETVIVILEGK